MKNISMKTILALCLALTLSVFVSVNVFAEVDFSQMSDSELYDLLDAVEAELTRRNQDFLAGSISEANFFSAQRSVERFLNLGSDGKPFESKKLNDDYFVSVSNGYRLLTYNNRILKASVRIDDDDLDNSVLRMYALAMILEGKLYEGDYSSNEKKHAAFASAQEIVRVATEVFSDNMAEVWTSRIEGNQKLAASGEYIYYWEFLSRSLWLTVELTNLPDGIE